MKEGMNEWMNEWINEDDTIVRGSFDYLLLSDSLIDSNSDGLCSENVPALIEAIRAEDAEQVASTMTTRLSEVGWKLWNILGGGKSHVVKMGISLAPTNATVFFSSFN